MRLPPDADKFETEFWDEVRRELPGEPESARKMIDTYRDALRSRLRQLDPTTPDAVAGAGMTNDDLLYHLSPAKVADAIRALHRRIEDNDGRTRFGFDRNPKTNIAEHVDEYLQQHKQHDASDPPSLGSSGRQ